MVSGQMTLRRHTHTPGGGSSWPVSGGIPGRGVHMLYLFNTMSGRKELFEPREQGIVRMFSCGPSIYRQPHVGNYRSFLWQDLLQRYLEYLGYRVERVLNLTDVEDKAIEEAEKEGIGVLELTERVSRKFFEDARLLRIKLPEKIPRSSTSVDQAVRLIEILMEKGYAYRHGQDIFFDPLKFEGFGKLFKLDMSRWPRGKRRFRRDTYVGRRWNLGDFILWHGFREGDKLTWDTAIGRGRPSWNIQDPAMITETLGYAIDISCGGVDNLHRHHDYNIAVIEAISGMEFSRFWIHGEHLLVAGKKMSKSLGNILYPSDFLKDGYDGRRLRFYLLYGHHRKRLNVVPSRVAQASEKLDALAELALQIASNESRAERVAPVQNDGFGLAAELTRRFKEHMDDDLDVRGAFDAVFETVKKTAGLHAQGRLDDGERRKVLKGLQEIDSVLQVIFK